MRALVTWLTLAMLLLASSCAAPLSVDQLSMQESYRLLNRSTLAGNVLSESTLTVLRRRGLMEAWRRDRTGAIAALHGTVVNDPRSWPDLFALAELSYLQGNRLASPAEFLAAAVYAYAFLFPETASDRPSPYDPRFRQACDIYNLGLSAAFTPSDRAPISLVAGRRSLPFGSIDLDIDQDQLRWGDRTLVSFQPTSTLRVNGLQNVFRAPGLGAPLAAMAEAGPVPAQGFQVSPRLRIPTNMLLTMDSPRRQLAQPALRGKLLIHTIFDNRDVQIGSQAVPLEYNQSAARALGLVEATPWTGELRGFLDGTLLSQSPSQLVALQPHQHGRMPIILVHGTASSPFRWADMVNDLLEDPAIRDHFEFWFFSYSTGNPVPYSALQLRQSVADAVRQLGGKEADPALGQMTIIGHSQGGLLAKMLVIDPGDRLWNGVSRRPLDSLKLTESTRTLLRESLFPHPLAEVRRVVFIATPHRGSFLADFSVAQLIGRLVTLPLTVTQAGAELLTGNGADVAMTPGRIRLGSLYSMSPNSPFIKTLATLPIAPAVQAHSIIAMRGDGPVSEGSDGVVRVSSARLDGVDSERIVQSGHSTQSNPETIAEVRRILLLQLASVGAGVAPPGRSFVTVSPAP